MIKNINKFELVKIIANRSPCSVKVGSIIYDSHGIFSWGWNHSGNTGYGLCAERHAISRSNRRRLKGAHIITISMRRNNLITSFPCPKCFKAMKAVGIKTFTCRMDNEFKTYTF